MKKLSLLSSTASTMILVFGIGGFSSNASAQSVDAQYIVANIGDGKKNTSLASASGAIVNAINAFFAYVKTNVAYDWTEKQPNLTSLTEKQNPLSYSLTTTQDAAVLGLAGAPISSVTGPKVKGTLTEADLSAGLASNYAYDVLPPTQQQAQSAHTSPGVLQACGNNMLNFESLMGYTSYANQTLACNPNNPQDVSQFANNYLQYASDLGGQINSYSITDAVNSGQISLDQATNNVQPSQEWMDFTLTRRHVLAVQSAALSNLIYLYNQRAPDANGNSPESVANYVANWRTQNVNGWYDTMGTTADLPILLRENLFIMAEIQRDLHEMRKENQRNLAATAILVAQSTTLGKQVLNLRYAALQKKIASITQSTSSSSSSGGTVAGGGTVSGGQGQTLNQINQQSSGVQDQGQAAINAAIKNAGTAGGAATTTNP